MIKNKKKTALLSIIILLSFMPYSALSQDAVAPLARPIAQDTDITDFSAGSLSEGMQSKISLDLRNIDVMEAVKFLALKAGISIIATKNVAGRVTLTVEMVPIQDIFDIMLRSNNLAYVKQRGIYNIMTEDEYRKIFGKNFFDIREVKTFRLTYAIPEQAFTMLDTLKSTIGRVLVEPDSGTVLVMDTPKNIKEIEKALSTLEEQNIVRIFNLDYANAKDIEEQLKSQLDAKKVGSIRANERSNLVIVQALSGRMEGIEQLITALDTKTKEVLIDTKMIKIRLSDSNSTGFEWEGIMGTARGIGMAYFGSYPFSAVQAVADVFRTRSDVLNDLGGNVGSYPASGYTTDYGSASEVAPGESMHVGVVSEDMDVDVLVNFLETLGNTQIISNPKIAVLSNHEARIHIGERQAYVTSTTTTGQSTSTVSEEVTFVDVGIQLAVTPTVNDKGYITMKIKPEISSVTSYLETPSKNKIPIIDTSTAETTVLVKDGTTIVIGGLRREDETEVTKQLPFLGNIPWIGNVFKSTVKTKIRTELLIMITPHIVSGDHLTTGSDRDFGHIDGKDYKDYESFVEEEDYTFPREAPEEAIKPYKEYTSIKKESEIYRRT